MKNEPARIADDIDGVFDQAERERTNGSGVKVRPEQRFKFVRCDQVELSAALADRVEGSMPRAGDGIVWWPPKGGKSFWTVDLFLHVALARAYRGRKVRQGDVAYLARGGGGGFSKRVEAWRRENLSDRQGV